MQVVNDFRKIEFPTVNFIGNKEKISSWILDHLETGRTFTDVFSGGSSVGFEAKKRGFAVTSNDIMYVNYMIGKSVIENKSVILDEYDIDKIFSGKSKKGFMYKNYSSHAFYPKECSVLDGYRDKILELNSPYKRALAFTLMRRAMIRKMPYSRFTIPWAKVRQLRDENYSYEKYGRKRAYHNLSFKEHFMINLESYNNAVFDNGQDNKAYNSDVFRFLARSKGDVAYIDPPYMGTMSDYHGFYGAIDDYIHGWKTQPFKNNFTVKNTIVSMLDKLFKSMKHYKIWALSYNNNSHPSRKTILSILHKYSDDVHVFKKRHNYQVSGSVMKSKNMEYLFLAKNGAL